jgi:plastocyanin
MSIVSIALFGALAVAGTAQAANWPVALGEQARPPAGTPKGATLNQFMPNRLVVAAGDTVTFSSFTFHTATYTAGKAPPALFVPDPKKGTYSDIQDAADNDFYFNGLPKLIYNPLAFGPFGGTAVDGKTSLSTGALSPTGPRKPATATWTFRKAGTYRLICTLHPGMQMDVVVRQGAAPLPQTPTQVRAEILKEQAAGWAKIKAEVTATNPPANTVYAGVGAGATTLSYYPNVLRVKAGTTVTFVTKSPSEVHNVAFGPLPYLNKLAKEVDLLPTGPGSPNQVAPYFPYGSEPKGQYTYDGQNHGNGFLATPLTAGSAKVPLPRAARVTFTAPGTYRYICQIHGKDMSGTIVVTQ